MKIGRHAAENGNTKAVRHFKTTMQLTVSESTVRRFKKLYFVALREHNGDPSKVTEIRHANRGRPLKLGELDDRVQQYIRKLRSAGGIVNKTVVLSAAQGIVTAFDKTLLAEYGGHINITPHWAASKKDGICSEKRHKSS